MLLSSAILHVLLSFKRDFCDSICLSLVIPCRFVKCPFFKKKSHTLDFPILIFHDVQYCLNQFKIRPVHHLWK